MVCHDYFNRDKAIRRYSPQRLQGFVLFWHDITEDTTLSLPEDTPSDIVRLVEEMTFKTFSAELEEVWQRDPQIRLFKLYDKVSNLLDAGWMNVEKWNRYVKFTSELSKDVETNYGYLNIVKIAGAICEKR